MARVGLTAAIVSLIGACWCAAAAAAVTLVPIGAATYEQPTYVTSDPRDPNRLFVTEQPGTIQVTTGAGTELFLDLTDEVLDGGSEQGLWSMAFAPDFAESGLFYVAYSANDHALTVDEFREAGGPAATEATRRQVLAIPNLSGPTNHNGGQLQFGPDGYLYWSTGEDANAANAQDYGNLLGKILRIDPRGAGPGDYTIPADNPFVGVAGADEIWAGGLRNPWRFSFDRMTGQMYIGDVGAGGWEEVDVGVGGANYGWPICEAFCSSPDPELTDPIYAYESNESPCNAITGGYVVRDPGLGDLYGRYLFSDACVGELRSINPANPPAPGGHRQEGVTAENPSSFGEDACGRLYVAAQGDGRVFRIQGDNGGLCPDGTPPPSDTDPPSTKIKLKRKSARSPKARYRLSSDEPGATFECKLDRRKWRACDKRGKLKRLDEGRHRFRARATDAAGNTDPTPAKKRFKVKG